MFESNWRCLLHIWDVGNFLSDKKICWWPIRNIIAGQHHDQKQKNDNVTNSFKNQHHKVAKKF